MIGMIKKDLLMLKNNMKSTLIAIAIYIFYSIMFEIDMSFFLPFLGLMLCMSTISYDEFNNWHAYVSTLPQGKINVIKSKYIITIGITTILTIVGVIISMIMGNMTNNYEEYVSIIMGELLAIIFVISVLYPILFKYGAEKGRLAMIVVGLTLFGIFTLLTKVIKIKIPKEVITLLDSYLPIISIIVAIILIGCSYLISKKIYLKKEF